MDMQEMREFGEGVESREVKAATFDYPREFPADEAGRVGRAILSRSFNRTHARDAWVLQGYAQSVALPIDDEPYRPVTPGGVVAAEAATDAEPFHSTSAPIDPSEEEIGEALINASARKVGANETGLPPLPWKSIAKLVAKLLIRLL